MVDFNLSECLVASGLNVDMVFESESVLPKVLRAQ